MVLGPQVYQEINGSRPAWERKTLDEFLHQDRMYLSREESGF